MRGLDKQRQPARGHSCLFGNGLQNGLEHHEIYIGLASEIQRAAVNRQIEVSSLFLKVQQADAGDKPSSVKGSKVVTVADRVWGFSFRRSITHFIWSVWPM